MFEYHGWLRIQVSDYDDPPGGILEKRMNKAINSVQHALAEFALEPPNAVLDSLENGLRVISFHGLRNHRFQPAIEMFQWAARNLPDSYGLLYVWDDEDDRDDSGKYANSFKVWRIARGELTEQDDPFLSPCVPTIERPSPQTLMEGDIAELSQDELDQFESLAGFRPTPDMHFHIIERHMGPPDSTFQFAKERVEYHYIIGGEAGNRVKLLFANGKLRCVIVEYPAVP